MTEIGYALSSEEHNPNDLVKYAWRAEEAGFTFALISDHYHPWIDRQGNAPFVWSVIGGIAQVTKKLRLGTGVTCPTIRIHPAIIAQAAATAGAMMPGRFFLGVGTGENLNEHILGDHWPPFEIRLDMLEEAVEIIRLLWEGGSENYWGQYYTVENARIYTLPDELPEIMVAASGSHAAELAGMIGDGLINVAPSGEIIETFESNGGGGKPRIGQLTVCWAGSEKEASSTAHEWWPNMAIKGGVMTELPTPTHFEQASALAREEDIAKLIPHGPDPRQHIAEIEKFIEAGYDHVYIHQIGPDQEGFFRFYEKEILPKFR